MRKCLKRSVVSLLLLTLCLTAINAINTTPAEAAANEIMVFPYPRPADNNRENWGKEDMSFMGGWALRATDYTKFPKTSLKQRLNPKDKGVIYMSDYEIFAILLRVIELVLIANLYKSTKK